MTFKDGEKMDGTDNSNLEREREENPSIIHMQHEQCHEYTMFIICRPHVHTTLIHTSNHHWVAILLNYALMTSYQRGPSFNSVRIQETTNENAPMITTYM